MDPHCNDFLDLAAEAMGQPERREAMDALGLLLPLARDAAVTDFGNFEHLRQHLKSIRRHALENLDYYLALYEEQAIANGNQVHFAGTGEELNSIVLRICQQHGARRIAKGKSMVTEETGLNSCLQGAGLEVMETDLGEYIIQQAGETPSHIVAPAIHKPVTEIRELFLDRHQLGERALETAPELVSEARQVLRQHFFNAEVGIIGANALVAENGYSLLVTNEGNGDLCANLPPVLIVCTTIERILPRLEDALALVRVLARSAIGNSISCYTSLYSGPRRSEELDGPVETHIVLLDNRRSEILASDYHEMLQCIRCGACLNHCPIYVAAGGHAYGWVYPGPMGSVLNPLLTSLEESKLLPNACTSCGRCEEVCPAAIPLPQLLRDLRHDEFRSGITSRRWRLGLRLHAWLARHPRLYRLCTSAGVWLLHLLGRKRGSIGRLPLTGAWTSQRDLPAPQGKTFSQLYRQRVAGNDDE